MTNTTFSAPLAMPFYKDHVLYHVIEPDMWIADNQRALSQKRWSWVASPTTSMSSATIAWAQNESLREISRSGKPKCDLNHSRFSSTREISAIGTPRAFAANRVKRSNDGSGGVSSNFSRRSAARRSGLVARNWR